MPFKLTLKKKVGSNKGSKERNQSKDVSLLAILQKQAINGFKPVKNLKIVREHHKVEPIAFYDPKYQTGVDLSTTR